MAFANGCCEGSFESDVVASYGVDCFVGDGLFAVFENGINVDGFPFYWRICGGVDVFY